MPDKTTNHSHTVEFQQSSYTGVAPKLVKHHSMTNFRHGEELPNWRQLIKDGKNATTWMEAERVLRTSRPGSVYRLWGGNPAQWYKMYGNVDREVELPELDQALLGLARSQALSRFINNCVEAQRSFAGSTFFGELRETLRMIKRPGKALRDGISRYSRQAKKLSRKQGSPSQKQKWLSGLWLEYFFGWVPLVNDIQELTDTLTRYDVNPFVNVSGKSKQSREAVDEYWSTSAPYWSKRTRLIKYSAWSRYKGSVWATAPYLGSFKKVNDFGFDPVRDFLPTVWELIPYSFLFDYFTNLGEIIQAYSFWSGNIRWTCKTERMWSSATSTFSPYSINGETSHPSWTFLENQPEANSAFRYRVVRDKPETLIPEFSFELLSNQGKWLNIAALLNERR